MIPKEFNFYNIDELVGFLFKCVNDKEVNSYDFENIFSQVLIQTPLPLYDKDINFIVRCRIVKETDKEIKTIKDLSYPPDINEIKLQRCNYNNQQVFYGSVFPDSNYSTTSFTAILETVSETITDTSILQITTYLSKWLVKNEFSNFILPFNENSIIKSKIIKKYAQIYQNYILSNNINTKFPFEEYLRLLFFISECFTQKDKKYYKLTSGFFNYLMNIGQVDMGLIYPSANTNGAGLNIALPINQIKEQNVFCQGAMKYQLKRNFYDLKKIEIYPSSEYILIDIDGNLIK
jgi:hypothetical protein